MDGHTTLTWGQIAAVVAFTGTLAALVTVVLTVGRWFGRADESFKVLQKGQAEISRTVEGHSKTLKTHGELLARHDAQLAAIQSNCDAHRQFQQPGAGA